MNYVAWYDGEGYEARTKEFPTHEAAVEALRARGVAFSDEIHTAKVRFPTPEDFAPSSYEILEHMELTVQMSYDHPQAAAWLEHISDEEREHLDRLIQDAVWEWCVMNDRVPKFRIKRDHEERSQNA